MGAGCLEMNVFIGLVGGDDDLLLFMMLCSNSCFSVSLLSIPYNFFPQII